ncbi:unnamed protein product [Prorocentrum cordatum]|uniref:Poly(ADP-ribose) glycohydrolase n=1 Tax=Prorocentrum cordatum TaxID=2364126 RepID=A0ABN9SMV8_9DINO|nr:unnamed protein product [Polarella glacialis]
MDGLRPALASQGTGAPRAAAAARRLAAAGDGLSAALDRCAGRATGYIYSLLSLLGVLSRELAGGGAGTFLVAMTPISPAKETRGGRSSRPPHCPSRSCAPTSEDDRSSAPSTTSWPGACTTRHSRTSRGELSEAGASCATWPTARTPRAPAQTLAFAFFAGGGAMINVPWTVLGARRYLDDLSGQTSVSAPMSGHCGLLKETDWLNQGMLSKTENVVVAGGEMTVYSTAFVAVASEVTEGCDDGGAKNNNCDTQRRHLDEDVSLWYQAFEPSQYHPAVRDALAGVVYRVGTGPWGAGAWWGDSQISFLTVWLATSLVHGISLDYYIYDHFCENPANQCFLLGGDECRSCVRSGESGDSNGPTEERCGERSIFDLVKQFRGHTAKELYDKLIHIPGPPSQDRAASLARALCVPDPLAVAARSGLPCGTGRRSPRLGGWPGGAGLLLLGAAGGDAAAACALGGLQADAVAFCDAAYLARERAAGQPAVLLAIGPSDVVAAAAAGAAAPLAFGAGARWLFGGLGSLRQGRPEVLPPEARWLQVAWCDLLFRDMAPAAFVVGAESIFDALSRSSAGRCGPIGAARSSSQCCERVTAAAPRRMPCALSAPEWRERAASPAGVSGGLRPGEPRLARVRAGSPPRRPADARLASVALAELAGPSRAGRFLAAAVRAKCRPARGFTSSLAGSAGRAGSPLDGGLGEFLGEAALQAARAEADPVARAASDPGGMAPAPRPGTDGAATPPEARVIAAGVLAGCCAAVAAAVDEAGMIRLRAASGALGGGVAWGVLGGSLSELGWSSLSLHLAGPESGLGRLRELHRSSWALLLTSRGAGFSQEAGASTLEEQADLAFLQAWGVRDDCELARATLPQLSGGAPLSMVDPMLFNSNGVVDEAMVKYGGAGGADVVTLAISARSGVPQNNLIAARGLGLMAAPVIFSSAIGRLLRAGQVFRCVSGALAIKAACELCVAARGACGPSLYAVFFAMGIGIGVLDTTADLVVTTVHGERCAVPLNVINALYGTRTGGMLAPFFALAAGDGAWHVLALADLALAAAVAARRLGRGRPGAALPGAALAGISGEETLRSGYCSFHAGDAAKGLAPMRVLVPALAFLVLAQAAETAVSAWGFTLAVSRLGLSSAVAARFPAVFYPGAAAGFSFTAARFAVVPASARVAPSALVRGGTLLAFCGALALLAALGGADGGGADAGRVRRLLACFALLGAGTCPMYAIRGRKAAES